ncbi:MAG: GNAT family N-acetyltransferase [Pseudomonadota bacterium]
MSAPVAVRPARPDDAEAIGALMREFPAYLRALGDEGPLEGNAAMVRCYGFGADAEIEGQVAGYPLYHFGFDSDCACRILHVIDLYVRESARRHGAGRALMERACEICRATDGGALFWAVHRPNELAARFYEGIGARRIEDLDFLIWKAGGR